MSMTREQAWDLLTQYNQEEFHLRHAVTVEHVMRWFARELDQLLDRTLAAMRAEEAAIEEAAAQG